MSKTEIILFAVAIVSLVTSFKISKENKKLREESKKHKCKLGTTFCNDKCCYYCENNYLCKLRCKGDPLTCGNAVEE